MRKNEIDALVRAHQGRVGAVASLHLLRQARLEPDDHAFLRAHADSLGPSDLLRWRSRCEPSHTADVLRELARRAIDDPSSFRHEVLDAPKLDIPEHEWKTLADLVRGRVPDAVFAIVLERGGPRPKRPPPTNLFTPKSYDSIDAASELDDDDGTAIDLDAARALPLEDVLAKLRTKKLDATEASLRSFLVERAQRDAEDWSRLAPDLPGCARDAVLIKLTASVRPDERVHLLMWLERFDMPRAELLRLAFDEPRPIPASLGLVGWLAEKLSTPRAWREHGAAVLRALLDRRAFGELGDVVALVSSDSERAHRSAVVSEIHAAMGEVLAAIAVEATELTDRPRALAALAALSSLGVSSSVEPQSTVAGSLAKLAKSNFMDDAPFAELVRSTHRAPSPVLDANALCEAIVASIHAFADATR
ncbi:MAG: hypothetical protein U0271_00545 [Polyangiaceae bacterium]